MKRRLFLFISLFLIAVCIFFTFIKFKAPAIEDIKSVAVEPEQVGAILNIQKVYFDLNKKEDKDMVNNILKWLNSGIVMGNARNEAISNGGIPTCLVIELKDGTEIFIKSSVTEGYMNNQTLIPSGNIKGQVTISSFNEKSFSQQVVKRVLSPKLKTFVESGWKDFFNYNK